MERAEALTTATGWLTTDQAHLRRILGATVELPEIELFSSTAVMEQVKRALDVSGLVDEPQFCMTRSDPGPSEPRLPLSKAVFIGGSVVPGDDVFIVLVGESVLVFDWSRPPPDRWVEVGTVGWLQDELSKAWPDQGLRRQRRT